MQHREDSSEGIIPQKSESEDLMEDVCSSGELKMIMCVFYDSNEHCQGLAIEDRSAGHS